MKTSAHTITAGLAAAVMAVTVTAQAVAEEAADFFKGRTVTYIVSTNPGGGYDTYGRLVAKYLEKHIPESKFIVKNVPGAGHIIGANQLYAAKPDGLTIGTFNTGLVYAQLLNREGVKFNLNDMTFIGKAAADPRVFIVGNETDVGGLDDIVNASEPLNFAVSGVGSAAYNDTKMLSEVLKLNINLITGFSGNEGELAIMRGEVVGTLGSRSSLQPFVDNGFGRILFQVGGESGDIPQARDLTTSEDALSLIALIQSQAELARITAAPPGVDPERAQVLIDAYEAAMSDPDLRAEAEKLDIPIEPAFGDDVRKTVVAALSQSPEMVALIASVFEIETPRLTVTTDLTFVSDDGKKIEFLNGDQAVKSKVSGSRTKITIDGAEADRKQLVQGMVCEISYAPGEDNEPNLMICNS